MTNDSTLVAIEILTAIKKTSRITAPEIAEQTGISTQYIRNTIRVLAELDLVLTPVRGVYEITELGNKILTQITGT